MPLVPGQIRQSKHHVEAALANIEYSLHHLMVDGENPPSMHYDLLFIRNRLNGILLSVKNGERGFTAPPLPPGNW